MDINILGAIEKKFDDERVKLERRVTATASRKIARVHLLIAQDQEDDAIERAKIGIALAAFGD